MRLLSRERRAENREQFLRSGNARLRHKGFTLLEVLVATVISVTMLTLVMGSFWTLWQLYREADLMREMQHEATFAMTRIADKVRSNGVDYDGYLDPNRCQGDINKTLCLGENWFLKAEDENLKMTNNGTLEPLFSANKFALDYLHFSVFPANKPNPTTLENGFQPQVTVHMELRSLRDSLGREAEPADALKFTIQTTISSRKYNF